MFRGRVLLSFLILIFISLSLSASDDWLGTTSTEGFRYFKPSEFFEKFHSPYFSEMADINPQTDANVRQLINYLGHSGIPIAIGTNSNIQSMFELYMPLITMADGQPATAYGYSFNSEVGNLQITMHDSTHHYAGIPGPRLKDLDDVEGAKKRLVKIMLEKEQIASSFSILDYNRIYWNWRDKQKYNRVRSKFVEANKGVFSMGHLPRDEYVDLVGYAVKGNAFKYFQLINKYTRASIIEDARAAGVPLPFPDLSWVLGLTGDSYFARMALPILEPILAYTRSTGYIGFSRYSRAMADLLYQRWYVKWADRFQFGLPLDEIEARAKTIVSKLKQGEPMGDSTPPAPYEFETKYLRNEVALFGRRVAEIEELGKRGALSEKYDAAARDKLEDYYYAAAEINDELLRIIKAGEYSADRVAEVHTNYQKLLVGCETDFPLNDFLPETSRLSFISYKNYWRDPTSIGVPRYGHNQSGISPAAIKRRVIELRNPPKNVFQRTGRWWSSLLQNYWYSIPENVKMIDALANNYLESQRRIAPSAERVNANPEIKYLNELDAFNLQMKRQVEDVILPQISEAFKLGQEDREYFSRIYVDFLAGLDTSIKRFKTAYSLYFMNSSEERPRSMEFWNDEYIFHTRVNRVMEASTKILDGLEKGRSRNDLSKATKMIEEETAGMLDPSRALRPTPILHELDLHIPIRRSDAQLFGYAFRYLFPWNKNIPPVQALESFRFSNFLRHPTDVDYRLKGWDPANAPKGKGVFVITLSHEQGMMEGLLAIKLLRETGVQKIIIMTVKSAWPAFKKAGFKSEEIVLNDEPDPTNEMVQRVMSSSSERIGVVIFPEGFPQYLYAQMPIAAKPGAFVVARRLANELQNTKPVYLLEGHYNGLATSMAEKRLPLEVTMKEPILVPTSEVSKFDPWVNEQRLSFENLINEGRSNYQIDLIHRRQAPGSKAPVHSKIKPYLPFSDWQSGQVTLQCGDYLKALPDGERYFTP